MASYFKRALGWLLQQPAPNETPGGYRIFTRSFDVVVDAAELDSVLGPLSADDKASLDEAWVAFSGALEGWRTRLHLAALEAASRVRSLVGSDALNDTTVTLLLDQSGSMRGQSMLLAAATIDVAQDFLVHLGVSVEVLGFTTVGWQGGQSRRRWLDAGSPANPGRLCDLLHIVYRDAGDMRASTGSAKYRNMLRPDLPRENVDGEAVQWALHSLRGRDRRRKRLLVISDGAPVDDATLLANGPKILDAHLREVLADLKAAGDVAVGAVGIGFDVGRYYETMKTVKTADDLGPAVIEVLERLLGSSATRDGTVH